MEYDDSALQTVRETRLLIDRYDAWLVNEFAAFLSQRVIEVGCGLGNLFKHLLECEIVVGIEPSEDTVRQVKHRFSAYPNIEIYQYSITDPTVLSLSDYRFDTAISLNVFEHIKDDECALRHTYQLLQPGGIFVLIVPAHDWLYGSMDKSIGHYRRYTKKRLRRKLENIGFDIVSQKYLNMLGALGWFINGRLLRRHVPPTGQLKLLNVLMPLLETIETRISPPFGISVLTIARKV